MELTLISALSREGNILNREMENPYFEEFLEEIAARINGFPLIVKGGFFRNMASWDNPLEKVLRSDSRLKIIISSNGKKFETKNYKSVPDTNSAIKIANVHNQVYAIGGRDLYHELMPWATGIELIRLKDSYAGGKQFPSIRESKWDKETEKFSNYFIEKYSRI